MTNTTNNNVTHYQRNCINKTIKDKNLQLEVLLFNTHQKYVS